MAGTQLPTSNRGADPRTGSAPVLTPNHEQQGQHTREHKSLSKGGGVARGLRESFALEAAIGNVHFAMASNQEGHGDDRPGIDLDRS
jgi:hypothetical protein